jgi:hypothetical protein
LDFGQNIASATVYVTRAHQSYDVHLALKTVRFFSLCPLSSVRLLAPLSSSGRMYGGGAEASAFEAIFLLKLSASARWLVSQLVSQEELI